MRPRNIFSISGECLWHCGRIRRQNKEMTIKSGLGTGKKSWPCSNFLHTSLATNRCMPFRLVWSTSLRFLQLITRQNASLLGPSILSFEQEGYKGSIRLICRHFFDEISWMGMLLLDIDWYFYVLGHKSSSMPIGFTVNGWTIENFGISSALTKQCCK